MAHDYKKLDDNEIVKLVDDNVRTSTGYDSSDLAKEREKVLQLARLWETPGFEICLSSGRLPPFRCGLLNQLRHPQSRTA